MQYPTQNQPPVMRVTKKIAKTYISHIQTEYKTELNDIMVEYDNIIVTEIKTLNAFNMAIETARAKYNGRLAKFSNEHKRFEKLAQKAKPIFNNIILEMRSEKSAEFNKYTHLHRRFYMVPG